MDPFAELWGPQPQPIAQGPLAALLQAQAGGKLPAGMRNNNPGNIKFVPGLNYAGLVGPSQNRDEGDPQMVFDTPQNGMNAASQLALKKYSGGKRTANDLIAGNMGWTPGNTSAAANVARTMGIGPTDDMQLSDPSRMQSFLKALTLQEHGPASRLYGDDVYGAVGKGGPAARAAPPQEKPRMPDPFSSYFGAPTGGQQPKRPGPLDSLVPSIAGGGDEQGYFGRLISDPTFLMGASVLGAGLSGRDAGSALTQGAQAATATSEMTEKRRRAAAWQKIMGGPNGPDMSAPLLKGLPAEVLPIIQSMGPDAGLTALHQIALKRLSPHALTSVGPGHSLYDETAGKEVFRAPSADDKPTNDMREYQMSRQQGFPGSLMDYQTQLKQAGRPQTNVSVSGDKAGAQEMGKLHAKEYEAIRTGAQKSRTDLAALDAIEAGINAAGSTGAFGETEQGLRRVAAYFGVGDADKVAGGDLVNAISNKLALSVRTPNADGGGMPGAMSDADREFLKSTVPGLSKTPGGNQQLIGIARKMAQRSIETHRMAVQYAQAHDGQLDPGFEMVMNDYADKNPLFGQTNAGRSGSAPRRLRFNPMTGGLE